MALCGLERQLALCLDCFSPQHLFCIYPEVYGAALRLFVSLSGESDSRYLNGKLVKGEGINVPPILGSVFPRILLMHPAPHVGPHHVAASNDSIVLVALISKCSDIHSMILD